MKINHRSRSPTHDPKKHAIWTISALKEEVDHFMTNVFPATPHEGCVGLPGQLFAKSLADQGARPIRVIVDDDAFRIMTMTIYGRQPTVILNKGIRVTYFRYWNDCFRDAKWRGTKVTVRYDPEDASYVLALVGSTWVRCECLSPIVRGFSFRELQVFAEECRAEAQQINHQKRVNPLELERFISKIRARELDLQREKAERMENQPAQSAGATQQSEASDDPMKSKFDFDGVDFHPDEAISRESFSKD